MTNEERKTLESYASKIRIAEEEIKEIRARLNNKFAKKKSDLRDREVVLIQRVYKLKEKFWSDKIYVET